MRKIIYGLVFVALVACAPAAPSANLVETAIAQTAAAQPTEVSATSTPKPTATSLPTATPTLEPTATPIALADFDFKDILILEGDLPAGYAPAQVRKVLPAMFDEIPAPDNALYQQFEHEDEAAGGVSLMIYEEWLERDRAYNAIVKGFGEELKTSTMESIHEELEGIGERGLVGSLVLSLMGTKSESVDMVFIRCHALVHIRFTDTSNMDYAIGYGQSLDERLTPLVCIDE